MRYAIVLTLLLVAGCMRLDDNLLSPGDEISEYKLDGYSGTVDFRLDTAMRIHQFTFVDLMSKGTDDDEAVSIKSIYLGDTSRIDVDTVIVYCHGYNHHMDFYWPRASLLANVGGKNRFGVMMMDYRGYGLSDGKPTEEGIYTDVDAAIKWLASKGLTQDRLVIYGFSLGGMPAVELAANTRTLKPRLLITENAWASPELLAQDAVKLGMPGRFFTNVKGDNAEKIKKVDQPYLNMHGDSDAFIKFETHALELRKNYGGTKLTALTVERADHEDLPEVMGFEGYMKSILDFLTKN
jgi:fermentation-respiration switch protein FrsA (DUF1100 family)